MEIQRIENRWSRREFIQRTGTAGLAAVGLVLGLTACGSEEKSEPVVKAQPAPSKGANTQSTKLSGDPCSDLSGLTPDEVATRTTFKYLETAEDPAKVCTSCNFWQEPKDGASCGGCTLVKGPIHPGGGCMSWVAILKS